MSNVHDHPIPLLVWKNFPSLKVFNDLGMKQKEMIVMSILVKSVSFDDYRNTQLNEKCANFL